MAKTSDTLRASTPEHWPVLLTFAQVADILQVSERTVRRRIDSRALPEPVGVGGTQRIRRRDLLAVLFPKRRTRR